MNKLSRTIQYLALFIALSCVLAPPGAERCQAALNSYNTATQRPYQIKDKIYYPLSSSYGFEQLGLASWYGADFHGRRTSSGEHYDMFGRTAAHKTLPMNTVLLVKNLENNREIVVRINDRGPFVRDRVIDLSYAAAKELHFVGKGTAQVRVVALAEINQGWNQTIQLAKKLHQGEYFVQIAAYAKPQHALQLRDRFLQTGHQAHVETYNTPKKTYYRVRVSAGDNLKFACQQRDILEERGYKGAFVVAR